jgi:mannosyl-oligosaccharide glucosidase
LLQRNFDWYRRTQAGDIKTYEREAFSSKEGYRWRGRTPRHTLTSGLDDYPRAQPPHIGELHVDLLSWIGLMARNIQRIASYLGETEDATRYGKIVEAIGRNVDDLHWSKENKAYCDVTADEYDESSHVCHKGYISLFPFMTGLIGPEHQHLKEVLDLIADENELWSPFGIRSLSTRDSGYGQDENYWRSPIWINMNYLIVKELLVSQWICSAHIYGLIRNRISHSSRDLSGSGRRRCIAHFARTWLTMSTIPGSTQALLGSNTTQTPVPDSAHSILRDGLVWWYS